MVTTISVVVSLVMASAMSAMESPETVSVSVASGLWASVASERVVGDGVGVVDLFVVTTIAGNSTGRQVVPKLLQLSCCRSCCWHCSRS